MLTWRCPTARMTTGHRSGSRGSILTLSRQSIDEIPVDAVLEEDEQEEDEGGGGGGGGGGGTEADGEDERFLSLRRTKRVCFKSC